MTGACDKAGHEPHQRSDGWVYCRRCHRRLYKGVNVDPKDGKR